MYYCHNAVQDPVLRRKIKTFLKQFYFAHN